MNSRTIYSGQVENIAFSAIYPPPEQEIFFADIQRRCPPIHLFGRNSQVFVLGVFPAHFSDYARSQEWSFAENQIIPLWDGSAEKQRRSAAPESEYSRRPVLWRMRNNKCQKFFAFCTEPSQEAVCHWASMLDQLFRMHKLNCEITTRWHQDSDRLFVEHTLNQSNVVHHLNELKRSSNRPVILMLGYTKMITAAMRQFRSSMREIDCGPDFSLRTWEDKDGTPMAALTVRYNYRGNIGTELARQLKQRCSLGGIIFATRVEQHVASTYQGGIIPESFAIVTPEGKAPGALMHTTPLLPGWSTRAAHISSSSTLIHARLIELGLRKGANTTGTELAYWARGAGQLPFQALGLTKHFSGAFAMLCAYLQAAGELGKTRLADDSRLSFDTPYTGGVYGGPLLTLPLHQVDPAEHTMSNGFTRYIALKGPARDDFQDLPVKVLGVAPEDLHHYAQTRGWKISAEPVWDASILSRQAAHNAFLPAKFGYTERPCMYRVADNKSGANFMLVPVMPSKEMVLHWGMLIRQRYPKVEALYHQGSASIYARQSLHHSGLLDTLIKHPEWLSGEAVLIMGYTRLTAQYLSSTGFHTPYAQHQEYKFQRQKGGISYCLLTKDGCRPVFLVNFEYCYWGELSGELANVLLDSGKLYGLLHVAKAGQMAGRHSFQQTYLPRSFALMKPSGEIVSLELTLDLFADNPTLAHARTGGHVSVSSTIEETYAGMASAKAKGNVTVDVEGAHLCLAATARKVRFGALYFASDYVATEPKAENHDTTVSLVSDPNSATEHKEETLREGIYNALVPTLGYYRK